MSKHNSSSKHISLSLYSVVSLFICLECSCHALIGVLVGNEHGTKTEWAWKLNYPLSPEGGPSRTGLRHTGSVGKFPKPPSMLYLFCGLTEELGLLGCQFKHLSWAVNWSREKKKYCEASFLPRFLRFKDSAPFTILHCYSLGAQAYKT